MEELFRLDVDQTPDEGDNPVSKRSILDEYNEGDVNVTTHRLEVSMQRQIIFIMSTVVREV